MAVRERMVRIARADGRVPADRVDDDVNQALYRLLGARPRRLRKLEHARGRPSDWPDLVDSAAFYGASDASIAEALGQETLSDDLVSFASEGRKRMHRSAKAMIRRAVEYTLKDRYDKDTHTAAGGVQVVELELVEELPEDHHGRAVQVADPGADPEEEVILDALEARRQEAGTWLDEEGLEAYEAWQNTRFKGSGTDRLAVLRLIEGLVAANCTLADHVRAQNPHLSGKALAKEENNLHQACTRARESLFDFILERRTDPRGRLLMQAALVVVDRRYRIHRRS